MGEQVSCHSIWEGVEIRAVGQKGASLRRPVVMPIRLDDGI